MPWCEQMADSVGICARLSQLLSKNVHYLIGKFTGIDGTPQYVRVDQRSEELPLVLGSARMIRVVCAVVAWKYGASVEPDLIEPESVEIELWQLKKSVVAF
jgi:hypothetical protein